MEQRQPDVVLVCTARPRSMIQLTTTALLDPFCVYSTEYQADRRGERSYYHQHKRELRIRASIFPRVEWVQLRCATRGKYDTPRSIFFFSPAQSIFQRARHAIVRNIYMYPSKRRCQMAPYVLLDMKKDVPRLFPSSAKRKRIES